MRKLAGLLLLVLILSGGLIGCAGNAAQKPMVQPNKGIADKDTPPPRRTAPQPNMERVLADRVANIASQVNGVKEATVVVSPNAGNKTYTAMVGIELTGDMKGAAGDRVKQQVADRVKSGEKRINKVLVTTDPNLITRLKDIASGVIKGRPVSGFAREIDELARRIAPTMR